MHRVRNALRATAAGMLLASGIIGIGWRISEDFPTPPQMYLIALVALLVYLVIISEPAKAAAGGPPLVLTDPSQRAHGWRTGRSVADAKRRAAAMETK